MTVQNGDDLRVLLRYGSLRARTHVVRGSGVDINRFVPRLVRDAGPLRILFAARLLWSKGIGEFVEVARTLAGPHVRFLVAGEPDPLSADAVPRPWLAERHDAGVVTWLGRRDDMPALLDECDIVCLPTTYREGLPRILLEAAAAGLPAVATDVPGCRDVVEHERTGLLVPPRDVPALTAALGRLIADESRREAMGRAARDRAEREFAAPLIADQMLGLYLELLCDPRRGRP